MKTLWFKQEFVAPILSGEKRDTIRAQSTRLPRVGDAVAFTVGPRPAFAHAIINSVETIASSDISDNRSQQLARCEIDPTKQMVKLTFSLRDKEAAPRFVFA